MLQQNGPHTQADDFPRHPEPVQLVAVADGPPRLRLVHEPLEQGRPRHLFAIDAKVGDEWRPVTHIEAIDEADADRSARQAFGALEDAELRIALMMRDVNPAAAAEAANVPLEWDNGNQCTYCGGQLDEFCRCFDCRRLRPGKHPVPFIPPSQRERPDTPPYDEGSIGLSVVGRPETPADIFTNLMRDHFGNGHLPLGRGGEAGE